MATVTLDQMKDKLLSIEQVTKLLEKTEPLSATHISSDNDVKFRLQPDWAHGIDALDKTDLVGVNITIDGTEQQMTKEAALQAGAHFGLTAAYAKKLPASYTEKLLNYHFGSGMGGNEFHVLGVAGAVAAFTKPTLVPFSNLQLLENVVDAIHEREGDIPIFADYKIVNSLQQTNVRLIMPTDQRVIQNTFMQDVPDTSEDVWLAGIHLRNSLIGKGQTGLEAYLFRWWCTNGATTATEGVEAWNRRANGQNDDVYTWAREQVDEIFNGLDVRFEEVQQLAHLDVGANTSDILRQIFTDYQVPVSQREDIQDSLLGHDDLTMYHVMNAITQAANDMEMPDARRDRLMRIGGAIPNEEFDTVKAQVWREGHSAKPTAVNPYEVRSLAS